MAELTNNYLHILSPRVAQWRLPVTRDQAVLLMVAFNEMMLGLDTYLAHDANQTLTAREWVPILFGPVAGILLLVAGLIALRRRIAAAWLATLVFSASMVVGVLGAYFHFMRGILPTAPPGQQITLSLLIWAPPFLAPFAFAGIGVMGLSAAWEESPVGSGLLHLPAGFRLQMPYSKTRAYFLLTGLGILMALISSVLDHARHPWTNPWLMLPVVVGVLGTVVAVVCAFLSEPLPRQELLIYLGTMLLLMAVGLVGTILHIRADLTSESLIVTERFLRGAPFMSPLLFTNMGMIGLLVLLPSEPQEKNLRK